MIVSPYTHDIDAIIVQLYQLKNLANQRNEPKNAMWFDVLIEIVKEWKYDNSQWDFKNDHYRQAVSFLMRLAEETPKDEYPEYFEARFYETMKNYRALKNRFEERKKKNEV